MKTPHPLPNQLWQVLQKHGQVRTPFEELQSRLKSSAETPIPGTVFAQGVARILRALFALDTHTQKLKLVFVRCDIHTVDLAYQADGHVLYIHDKWLQYHGVSHACHPSIEPEASTFVCHHVVQELYCRALAIIYSPSAKEHSLLMERLVQKCQQQLEQMPRMIRLLTTEDERALEVSFTTGHSLAFAQLYGSQVRYMVVLHGSSCVTGTNGMESLMYDMDKDACDCPRKTVSLDIRTVRFSDLNQGPWVPVVARLQDVDGAPDCYQTSGPIRATHGALMGTLQQTVWLRNGEIVFGCPIENVQDRDTAANSLSQLSAFGQKRILMPDTEVASKGMASAQTPAVSCIQDLQSSQLPDERSLVPGCECISHLSDGPAAESHVSALPTCSLAFLPTEDEIVAAPGGASITDTDRDHGQMAISPRQVRPRESSLSSVPCIVDETSVSDSEIPRSLPDTANNPARSCQANGLYRSCDQYVQFSRRAYARVTLREPDAQGHTARYVLYVHDILLPTDRNNDTSRLLVTKYSFLVNHCVFQRKSNVPSDRELLLHFRDIAKMGEEEDAELIDTRNVELEDVGGDDQYPTVFHATRTPDSAGSSKEYFARYAACGDLQDGSFFVTPLAPPLPDRGCALPLSTIPVASVFDVSFGDTKLSAAFARAGYPIRAAVIGDNETRQWWLDHCPGAFLCSGDPASVIADVDSGKSKLPGLEDPQLSRIVTIAGCSRSALPDPDPTDAAAAAERLREHTHLLQCCTLVALSAVWSADFIVLELHRIREQAEFWEELAETTTTLLARGYAVSLRKIGVSHTKPELPHMAPDVVLLAVPGCTNPRWIDDALADCAIPVNAPGCETRDAGSPLTATVFPTVDQPAMLQDGTVAESVPLQLVQLGTAGEDQPSALNDSKQLSSEDGTSRRSLAADTAHRHAMVVSRIIGELSKHRPSLESFSFRGSANPQGAIKRRRV